MNLGNAATVTGNALSTVNVLIVNEGLSVLAGVLILIVGWIVATWAKRLTARGLAHVPLDLTLKPLIASLIRYVILAFTIILVLGQFGVQTTSLIAVLGAAGLAVGLALQGTLSNVAAGVMLLVLRPFRVGHFVLAGGVSGTIREIGLFTTLMTTRDLVYISIPNSAVWSGVITNYTREPLRRVTFTFPVDIANDIDKVEKAILTALSNDPKVMKAPEPWVGVSEIGEYSVTMSVNCYAHSEDYWRTLPAVQKNVKSALDKASILFAVTRQAAAVRNERETSINRVIPPPSERRPEAAE
ncbi:MAG TPA: mechanosensitive ion channel domain-containing protein [Rhizomicrobium sp.]|nr:mechanosensitive ion channel domain-containing protein [Rhizomicrobium sp.]